MGGLTNLPQAGCSWEPCIKSEVLEICQGRRNTVGRGRVGPGRGWMVLGSRLGKGVVRLEAILPG